METQNTQISETKGLREGLQINTCKPEKITDVQTNATMLIYI